MRRFSESGHYAGQIETPVESVDELGKVTQQMLGPDRVVRTLERILDVAEHGIDPGQSLAALPAFGAPGDQGFVGISPGSRAYQRKRRIAQMTGSMKKARAFRGILALPLKEEVN